MQTRRYDQIDGGGDDGGHLDWDCQTVLVVVKAIIYPVTYVNIQTGNTHSVTK